MRSFAVRVVAVRQNAAGVYCCFFSDLKGCSMGPGYGPRLFYGPRCVYGIYWIHRDSRLGVDIKSPWYGL